MLLEFEHGRQWQLTPSRIDTVILLAGLPSKSNSGSATLVNPLLNSKASIVMKTSCTILKAYLAIGITSALIFEASPSNAESPNVVDQANSDKLPTAAQIIENSSAGDWRTPSQDSLVYMHISSANKPNTKPREIVFELAEDFAPQHIANLKQLIAQQYFDGLAITRSHDNYVVQWGDPNSGSEQARSLGKAKASLVPEFTQALTDVSFTKVNSRDAYADQVGFSNGFAVAADDRSAWLTHCYGALGVGRGMATDSGNAAELYVVTGHAPRHLDKNVTLIGRVVHGIEHLSSLPRGTGPLGFYEDEAQHVPIISVRMGNEVAKDQQLQLSILRTNTATFNRYLASRTTRQHEWFLDSVGKIEICNVGVPIRETP